MVLGMAYPSYARWSVGAAGGGVAAAPAGETCTGSLIVIAHFENSDTITTGTPAGCSATGDTTWDLATGYGDSAYVADPATGSGSYSLNLPTDASSEDRAVLGMTSIDGAQMRVDFFMKISALPATGDRDIIVIGYDDDNIYRLQLTTDGEITASHRGGGYARTLTTTDCDMTTATWYHIVSAYREGTSDPSMYVTCGVTTASTNDNLYSQSGVDPVNVTVGYGGNYAFDGMVDYLKVYNTYSD